MPFVAKDDVADHQKAPFVAKDFQRQVDRAAGAMRLGHGVLRPLLCQSKSSSQPVAKIVQIGQ